MPTPSNTITLEELRRQVGGEIALDRRGRVTTGHDYAADLMAQLRVVGLPLPVREWRFAPPRRWAFDLAYPHRLIAVEIEGGIWLPGGGRHNRGSGFERDIAKYNAASLLGWHLVRVTGGMVQNGAARELVERALATFPAVGA